MNNLDLAAASAWVIPICLILAPLYAMYKGVDVYGVFCKGAAQGLAVLLQILPFLLGMLVAIEVFSASGAMGAVIGLFQPVIGALGLPAEVLPLAVLRSLSGSGALAFCAQIMEEYGPDSFIGRLAATMQGSTDTTFYVLTVYFGSVGIMRYRHALLVGIIADLAAFTAAFVLCSLVWG